MDDWFPFVVLFLGLFLQLALQGPEAARRLERIHPIPGSYQRIDRVSWILIIAGTLWGIQVLVI